MTETECKRNWLVIVNSSCSVGSDPHFPAGSGWWCFGASPAHWRRRSRSSRWDSHGTSPNESGVQRKDGWNSFKTTSIISIYYHWYINIIDIFIWLNIILISKMVDINILSLGYQLYTGMIIVISIYDHWNIIGISTIYCNIVNIPSLIYWNCNLLGGLEHEF